MYLWFKQPWLFTEKRSPFLTEFIAKTTIDPMCTISSEMCPTSSEILQYIYYKRLAVMQHTNKITVFTYLQDGETNRISGIIVMAIGMCSTEDRRGTHIHCNAILQTDYFVELLCAVKQSGTAGVKSSSSRAAASNSSTAVVKSSSSSTAAVNSSTAVEKHNRQTQQQS